MSKSVINELHQWWGGECGSGNGNGCGGEDKYGDGCEGDGCGDLYECGDGDDGSGQYDDGDWCDKGEYVLNPESFPKAKFWSIFISTANTKTYTKYDCLK